MMPQPSSLQSGSPRISIVTPVYKAEDCLHELYRRLVASLAPITDDFEIIMVEDGSGDRSWEIIAELAKKDSRVKGIRFSRNFGQHYAITAGLDYARGDWVVVMDCDLQDQPEEIKKLYDKAQEGYDVVFGRRYERKDKLLKRLGSRIFFKIFEYFTESSIDSTVANFGLYSRRVIENFRKIREHNRAFPMFILWLGFNTSHVNIEHAERFAGKTSYNFSKLLNLAIDSIVTQTNKPLRLSIKFGFLLSFLSFLLVFYYLFRYFAYGIPVPGWPSLMVTLLFIGGLLFANMGLLGLYIGKIFDETKNRPLYIIKETTGNITER